MGFRRFSSAVTGGGLSGGKKYRKPRKLLSSGVSLKVLILDPRFRLQSDCAGAVQKVLSR